MVQQYPAPVGYYTNSPPTPAASDRVRDRKRAKGSNRPIAPHKSTETPRSTPDVTSHPRKASRRKSSENPVKPARQTKNKKGKGEVPVLTAPLSELTKSYHDIPLKDMDEWVNRSVETRLKECSKKEGWIPRPMNSFMLYRSAYAERTKHWCLRNNHQVVSSVSGMSWPMEPPEIRERFIEYARQERENHAKAHPGYKFSPAKTDASRHKRKGANKEQDDNESVDLEELDYDWQPGRGNKNIKGKGRTKRAKTSEFHVEQYETHAAPRSSPTKQSTFRPRQHNNPQYDEHYHEIMVDADFFGSDREEDETFLPAEAPPSNFLPAEAPPSNGEPTEELVGLPGADHQELLLDPQLNGDNINVDSNPELGMPLDPGWDAEFFKDFDFSQLSELHNTIGETILQSLGDPEFFDTLASEPIGPQVSGNQLSHQNEAENGHPNSVQKEGLNEDENRYQNVHLEVYHNQGPEVVEDEKPKEFLNTPEQTSIAGDHGPEPQKIREKLHQEKVDVEKFDDEKHNDEKPSDEKPGNEKPSDDKPSDDKPSEEKPSDTKSNDEKLGSEKLDHGPGDNKELPSTQ